MKRILLSLVLWMAIGAAAAQTGGPRPAEVVLPLADGRHLPAVKVGNECYVTEETLQSLGWTCHFDSFQATVAAGQCTARATYRVQADTKVVPLGEVLKQLGCEGAWRAGERVFDIVGIAAWVRVKDGWIDVESPLPFRVRVSSLDAPPRLLVDCQGLRLGTASETLFQNGARAGQFQPDTVRIVVPLQYGQSARRQDLEPTLHLRIQEDQIVQGTPTPEPIRPATQAPTPKLDPAAARPGESRQAPPAAPKQGVPGRGEAKLPENLAVSNGAIVPSAPQKRETGGLDGVQIGPRTPAAQRAVLDPGLPAQEPVDREPPTWNGPKPVRLTSITLTGESDAGGVLVVKLTGALAKPMTFRHPEAKVFELVLPGAAADLSFVEKPASRYLSSVGAVTSEQGLALRFEFTEPLGIQVGTPPGEIHLALIRPKSPGGSLAGKIIVVDAGHGGNDTGAKSPDERVKEKDLALAIAGLLAEGLSREGAVAVMTRKTDVLIPLKERPEIANRNGADFFVSVHINSNVNRNSASGGITFYHAKDPVAMLLAECLQGEIAKVSGLPNLGAWSDTRIYDSGFAVLRYAKMPAVLVEMGFINNVIDRARLIKPEFHRAAADAIVRGIKVYLGHGEE